MTFRCRIACLSLGFILLVPWGILRAEEASVEKPGPISVYEVKPVRDGVILGAATLASLFPVLNDYHFIYIHPQNNPEDLIPWDRNYIYFRNVFLDNLSDATVAVAVAAPVVLDYFDVRWTHVFFEDMMVYAQTMMINSTLSAIFKYTTQRPIPRVYAGDPKVKNSARGYEGFYSGHVATTTAALTAAAVTLDLRHDSGVWPWIVMLTVGTSVAIERVQAGEHFPTQVLTGGVMGPIVGFVIPWLHKREIEGKPTLSLSPALEGDGTALTWTRHF